MKSCCSAPLLVAAVLFLSCTMEMVSGHTAVDLKPARSQAIKEIKQAEQARWDRHHGNMLALQAHESEERNCTATVPTLPPRIAIHSDSCSLWRKTGHVEDEYHKKLMVFGLNCLSLTPTDIDFITADGDPAFRTAEKYFDWGVKVTVKDCNGKDMAVVKENLLHSFAHTPRAEYVVELPDGTEIARSKQGSFLSDTFMVFNTQEGAQEEDGSPEPLAYARVSKGAKLTRQFCMGGSWRLNVNEYASGFWADPRSREVLMVLATVKAIRDADRDNMGRVTEARCSEGFWLSIILIPLLLLGVILCFLCLPDSVCGIVCGCFKRMKYHPV